VNSSAPERRQQLLRISLQAVVADLSGGSHTAADLPGGAWLVDGATLWVRLDDAPHRALGAAIAIALREEVDRVEVLVGDPDPAPLVARRASQWSLPISVRGLDGRSPFPVEPVGHRAPPTVPDSHLDLVEIIVAAGAEPVVAHGVLTAHYRGLEIAKVVDDDGAPRLDVGVGVNDREAFRELHAGEAPEASLARVVEAVSAHRVDGARPHPFNTMSPEGYLAWRLRDDPSALGVGSLVTTPGAVAPVGAVDPGPVMMLGGGRLFACTTGFDLGALPDALDAREVAVVAGVIDDASLTVVVPARNRLPVIDRMASAAAAEVRVVEVP